MNCILCKKSINKKEISQTLSLELIVKSKAAGVISEAEMKEYLSDICPDCIKKNKPAIISMLQKLVIAYKCFETRKANIKHLLLQQYGAKKEKADKPKVSKKEVVKKVETPKKKSFSIKKETKKETKDSKIIKKTTIKKVEKKQDKKKK